jgi:hypothetical protein
VRIPRYLKKGRYEAIFCLSLGYTSVMHTERQRIAVTQNLYKASLASAEKRKANRITLVCAECGAEFSVPPSIARNGRVCCSNPCRYAYKRGANGANAGGGEWMIGENNPRWTGADWRTRRSIYREGHAQLNQWRRRVYARDHYTCQHCGLSPTGHNQLRAHHIQAWATHPELRFDVGNGLTLCHPCHLSVHRN